MRMESAQEIAENTFGAARGLTNSYFPYPNEAVSRRLCLTCGVVLTVTPHRSAADDEDGHTV